MCLECGRPLGGVNDKRIKKVGNKKKKKSESTIVFSRAAADNPLSTTLKSEEKESCFSTVTRPQTPQDTSTART